MRRITDRSLHITASAILVTQVVFTLGVTTA